jgi:ElaB/YqjD/DUF883 family membrane-anchored ribosome-binding protein
MKRSIENEVKAVEAEVVKVAEEVKEVVVSDAERIKNSVLAQKANFSAQLDGVRKEMAKLQQDFEQKKILGVKLEGALESIELLLKSL